MVFGALGIAAAALQIAGYAMYIRNFMTERIRPNAASFLMFSYGTSLLAFLEWRNNATWPVLLLPVICAILGILVAAMCLRRGATDPIDRFEGFAFSTDLWLTIAYAWFALGLGASLGFATADSFVAPFLIVTNLTAITCFIPIVRSTWRAPHREKPGPWFVWTAAYLLLGVTTYAADRGAHPSLLLYPVLNAVLHGAVAMLSLRRKAGGLVFGFGRRLYVDGSAIEGAARRFVAGSVLSPLYGKLHRNPRHTDPNWIGIGPDTWIEAAHPFNRINHSCAPNAQLGPRRQVLALHDIAAGEEVTIDYSTTECDPSWHMTCGCRTDNCRQGLFAIQFSFRDAADAPPATPLMQRIWAKRRIKVPDTPAFEQLGDNIARLPVKRGRSTKAAQLKRVAS
jgi:SET domain